MRLVLQDDANNGSCRRQGRIVPALSDGRCTRSAHERRAVGSRSVLPWKGPPMTPARSTPSGSLLAHASGTTVRGVFRSRSWRSFDGRSFLEHATKPFTCCSTLCYVADSWSTGTLGTTNMETEACTLFTHANAISKSTCYYGPSHPLSKCWVSIYQALGTMAPKA